jgi:hypothetical protein
MKDKRDSRIGFRCSQELKDSLEELASKDKRKLGDFLNVALSKLVGGKKTD